MDRIIVMPLIGSIDTMRARDIMRTLLTGIRESRAKVVILDITGVPLVDSGVANHLNKTIWSDIETLADLRAGLVVALASLGLKLSKA